MGLSRKNAKIRQVTKVNNYQRETQPCVLLNGTTRVVNMYPPEIYSICREIAATLT
jgi:hypothetical protein